MVFELLPKHCWCKKWGSKKRVILWSPTADSMDNFDLISSRETVCRMLGAWHQLFVNLYGDATLPKFKLFDKRGKRGAVCDLVDGAIEMNLHELPREKSLKLT